MALEAHAPAAGQHSVPPTLEEEDDFYAKFLTLRDAVVAGSHPSITLSASEVAQLKAALLVPESPSNASPRAAPNGFGSAVTNGSPASTNLAAHTNPTFPGLPGLTTSAPSSVQRPHANPTSSGLDPIFLAKSGSLVRAEGQLKRQRIERDLLDHSEVRGTSSSRDKDPLAEALSNITIDATLAQARKRVQPMSGLKAAPRAASISTSFDENDYYSSQVQSEWSSEAGSKAGSDQAVAAPTADFETLDRRNGGGPGLSSKARGKQPLYASAAPPAPQNRSQFYTNEPDGLEEADDEDEDDEYSPPEPFDGFYEPDSTMGGQGMDVDEDDDDDDYEPGDVTQGSVVVTPYANGQSSAQPSPQVPIYRNHLSHIAAPQPNRVSPLAVQKGPSIELELVNGRPEVVNKIPDIIHKGNKHLVKRHKPQFQAQSRPSSASPSGPGAGPGPKKKQTKQTKGKNKKRKRDQEREQEAADASERPSDFTRSKRQDRQNARSPPSPTYQETFVKPEPVSPQPFSHVPEAQPYQYRHTNQVAPIQIDPEPPHYPPQPQYVYASTPRYEHAPQMPPPNVVRVSSAAGHRPPQRDNQDLRRVASLHYAQRPASPAQRVYSPAGAYAPVSRAYPEPRLGSVAPYAPELRYAEEGLAVRYPPTQEPARLQEYRESSPAMMPPPSAPPRRIFVDQYGQRFYAPEPAPQPRASVAPVARHYEPEIGYERAPSRMPGAYQLAPQQPHYEPVEPTMPPPPPPVRRHAPQEQAVEYTDSNGYRVREYSTRPAEPPRYSHAPTSPVYQQQPQYEQMPPPSARPAPRDLHYEQMPPPPMPQPMHEPTSPMYAHPPRAYSVRPDVQDVPQPQLTYAPRQASVAPVQYIRHEPAPPPTRAMSVMPGPEYGAPAYQQRAPSYAPQPAVRYVDEYGREVAPNEIRQASQFRY